MKQPGFTLIELSITIMITSIMVVMLYQVYAQSNAAVSRIRSFLTYTETLPPVYQQAENDIVGIFVPQQGYPETEQVVTTTAAPAAPQKAAEKEPEKPKEKPAKIQDVVSTQYEKDNLIFFTFITTNAWIIYGEITPHAVRVAYWLEKIPESDVYKLMRSETTDLILDKEKLKKNSTEMMRNIKKFTATFYAAPKEEKSKEKEKKPEKEKEYKKFKQWTQEEQKKTKRITPDFVELSGSIIIDPFSQRERSFNWLYQIPATERQEKEKPAPGQQQPALPALQVQSPQLVKKP